MGLVTILFVITVCCCCSGGFVGIAEVSASQGFARNGAVCFNVNNNAHTVSCVGHKLYVVFLVCFIYFFL